MGHVTWFILGFVCAAALLVGAYVAGRRKKQASAPAGSKAAAGDEKLLQLGTLAGGLAHEIKNPLSTLSVNLQLLKEEWQQTNSPASRRMLARIAALQQETKRLEDILNDFLRFARRDELKLEDTDINRLLEEIVDFIKPRLVQHDIEILTYFDHTIPGAPLDTQLMKQALLNIFFNAEQAMPDGGQIIVKTSKSKNSFRIEIIDTGQGIPDDIKGKIFDVYFSTKKGGTGLGLPTAARIIAQHDGEISFQSESGRGTNFIIDMPLERKVTG